ncbi:Stp1/IreP family PP2C-type Ser/Thr phosphatase [Chloroflexota bacterium]
MKLQVAKLTDTGRSRPHNEDCVGYYVPPDPEQLESKGALYLAADGMGGHSAGEVASAGAVELVTAHYYSDTTHDTGTSLVRAFRAANKQIFEQAQADASKAGMGTTLVGAVLQDRKVYIANVGDSRAYLINERGITRITEDHSWVEEQIKAGLLSREEARRHPQRNVVTRALGTKPAVEVDLFEGELTEGDLLLLCSDGLTGHVEDQEIAAIALQHPAEDAARLLIAQANERGGHDNISVVIVSAHIAPPPAPATLSPATVVRKPQRSFPLIPVLAAVAGAMILALVALVVLPPLIRGTPTPVADTPPVVVTTVPVPGTETADSTQTAGADAIGTDHAIQTETALTATSEAVAPAETPSPDPTMTPAEPTATLKPPDTPTSKPGATRTPRPTASPQPTSTPDVRPPELLQPPLEDPPPSLHGPVVFNWTYSGELGPDQAFQVLIWQDGDPDQNGAYQTTRLTVQEIDLDGVPRLISGGPGDYLWSVVVVDTTGTEPPGPKASPREFVYAGPQL